VGNNLIADNYYTAQQPNTTQHGHAETFSIIYITRANIGATVTESRGVWGTCGIDGGHEFDHGMGDKGKSRGRPT